MDEMEITITIKLESIEKALRRHRTVITEEAADVHSNYKIDKEILMDMYEENSVAFHILYRAYEKDLSDIYNHWVNKPLLVNVIESPGDLVEDGFMPKPIREYLTEQYIKDLVWKC